MAEYLLHLEIQVRTICERFASLGHIIAQMSRSIFFPQRDKLGGPLLLGEVQVGVVSWGIPGKKFSRDLNSIKYI